MLGKFSLKIKLIVAFLILAGLVGAVSYYQIKSINHFDDRFVNLVERDFRRLDQLRDIRLTSLEIERTTLRQLQQHQAGTPLDVATYKADIAKQDKRIKDDLRLYNQLSDPGESNANQRALLKTIGDQTSHISTEVVALIENQAEGGTALTVAAAQKTLQNDQSALSDNIETAINSDLAVVANENTEINNTVLNLSHTSILLALAVTLIAMALGLYTAYRLVRSINRIKEGASRIASGDFSRQIVVKSHDEIGQLGEEFNRMANRLRDSYARLAFERQRDETLMESMSDGLIAIDDHGRIVLVNSRAVEILDLSERSELEDQPIDSVLKLTDQQDRPLPPDYQPARTAFETAKQVNGIFTHHKSAEHKVLVNIAMSPVVLDGKGAGVIMVIRDVTREREIDRMKTEFISLASHQLRTPLSAIKWFTEMLISGDAGDLTKEQMEFAKNVSDSTERMIELVNSLLNISRIESGRIIVDPRPTDMNELVTGIVNDLKGKTVEREQTLIVSVNKELPKVNLDPRLIGQVFLNLLTNAIKYTPKGGEISVFVSRRGDQLISQVTDNGYGIPKEQHNKVFQKFFRADNVAKVETDGTGLGLYLIKAIVESSGGQIWFESEEGKGTTFWFTLPMSGMKAHKGEVTLDS